MGDTLGMASSSGGRVAAIDHVGYVVTDLEQAVKFFVEVLGFAEINRRGHLVDSDSDRMTRLFGVHPRAEGNFVFLELGPMKVELLQWSAPDQQTDVPRNADLGGRHLALTVEGLDDFLTRLALEPGVIMRKRNDRGFYYVGTPFGLELQLIPS